MPVKALLKRVSRQANPFQLPTGQRIYAVGDIHGRIDLLEGLVERILADDQARALAETQIIFLGDLIDRGPASCEVVDFLIAFSAARSGVRFLLGNHEQVFLRALSGDERALRLFDRIGGRETILSYGLGEEVYRNSDYEALAAAVRRIVPASHVEFISKFEHWVEAGDYLFVHAGIRPGVALESQQLQDLCWIRDEFLDCRDNFGRMIVHGHTVSEEVEIRSNRIGIDTGAYASGRLTAVMLEGRDRAFLST